LDRITRSEEAALDQALVLHSLQRASLDLHATHGPRLLVTTPTVNVRDRRQPCERRHRPPSLLLLLLLLVFERAHGALGPSRRRLAERLERNRSRLGGELRERLGGGDDRADLGAQRLAGGTAEDALVGRHVVVVTPVAHHHVALVDGALVRRVERDPAVRRRPELDPGVALRGLAPL